MKAHVASAFNAYTLLIMGGWGYSVTQAPTALIPVFLGVILLVCNNGIKYDNKIMAHIAVVLTFLLIGALMKPFMGAVSDGDTMGMVRVGLMLLTTIIAFIAFIMNFIAAKKKRKAQDSKS